MGFARVGYKRLYNSPGCSVADRDDLDIAFEIGDMKATVYFVRNPRLGISVIGGGKYVVPGQTIPFSTVSFGKSDANTSRHIDLVTEIVCSKRVEVDQDRIEEFNSGDSEATKKLLEVAEQSSGP
jgi:hypothetical protein